MQLALLNIEEMRRADRLTIAAGTNSFDLMRGRGTRGGGCSRSAGSERPILVIAGRGNNGGDGLIAAADLRGAAARSA